MHFFDKNPKNFAGAAGAARSQLKKMPKIYAENIQSGVIEAIKSLRPRKLIR